VVGDNPESGTGAPPARRIRPHWWAVLAVSVSLLALVAATAGHPKTPGNRAAAPRRPAHHDQARSTAPAPATTTTTLPGPGPSTVTPPTSSSLPPATTSTKGARVVVVQSSTATTTTTTTTSPAGGSSVAAAVQSAAPIVIPGDLQQPDDASATYPFTGAGPMQVSASSTSSVPLLLTVTCPAGTVDEAGSSFVSVVIPNATGPCDAVLKETVVQYVAVPFTLTIGPAGG
jgi:hypothetical protein